MTSVLPASGPGIASRPPHAASSAPTDFAAYWELLRERLSACHSALIQRFFATLPQDLVASIDSVVGGGRKVRARILCTVCEALGGSFADALPRAMAIECIQAASLIHDDWIDGDRVRRNAPAVWTLQGARRAVLLADVIFATALERCAESGRLDVLALSKAIAAIAAGAYQEPLELAETSTNGFPRIEGRSSYDRLIFLKTGALFAAAAELGAIGARADTALQRAAYDYGARIGEAYQLADDLEDLVRHSGAVPLQSQDVSALFILLGRFGMSDSDQGREPQRAEVLRCAKIHNARLERAMEDEITARLASAAFALKKLPETPWRRVLEAIPNEVVRRRD
jgi:geranylgeranyl pyrophosphate synthase